jgi:hypothetical protein
MRSRFMRHTTIIKLALLASLGFGASTAVPRDTNRDIENRDIEARRSTERRVFSDAEITYGFLKITFGTEFPTDQRPDRIRRYDGPVRIFIDSRAKPDRRGQVVEIVADIGSRVNNLDIAVTQERNEANVVVTLVLDRDLAPTIRSLYGRERAQKIQRSLEPQCLASFAKDETSRILRSEVILVVDAGDFVFYDCAYEEILQALGPINDDNSVPWTMFNDDVSMGFFDVYDQLLLNILYDPRVKPGMTREDTLAMLPLILPDARQFVARTNNFGP